MISELFINIFYMERITEITERNGKKSDSAQSTEYTTIVEGQWHGHANAVRKKVKTILSLSFPFFQPSPFLLHLLCPPSPSILLFAFLPPNPARLRGAPAAMTLFKARKLHSEKQFSIVPKRGIRRKQG